MKLVDIIFLSFDDFTRVLKRNKKFSHVRCIIDDN